MVFSQYRSPLENWELMSSLHEYSLTFTSLLIKIFRLGNLPGQEDPLEWETATHSSILAWEIAQTGGVWRAAVHGSQRVDTSEHLRMYDSLQASGATARAWVQSLIGELRSCKPHGVAKKRKKDI